MWESVWGFLGKIDIVLGILGASSLFGGKKANDKDASPIVSAILFITGAVVLIISIISIALPFFNNENGISPPVVNSSEPSSYSDNSFTCTASSYLNFKDRAYPINNIYDGTAETAWIAGKSGLDIGEWVKLDFRHNTTVSGISIINGWARAANEYKSYYNESRVKKISIEGSDGFYTEADLEDGCYSFQEISFEKKITTSYLKITILDIYQGDSDNFTAISEIKVF